ncbi:hypothetical protein ACOI1H_20750 [Loktanella sp. DJP18]|uniref:hypothetical protein n=1 Tax=Loktanella sp. DJP18 TaxID=3409788 RepID=UPI003BB58D0C
MQTMTISSRPTMLTSLTLKRSELTAIHAVLDHAGVATARHLDALLKPHAGEEISIPLTELVIMMAHMMNIAQSDRMVFAMSPSGSEADPSSEAGPATLDEDAVATAGTLIGRKDMVNIADLPLRHTMVQTALRSMARDDLMGVAVLPEDLGAVAYFSSDKGLRSYGQSSLVQGDHGWFGIVMTINGGIPNDADAWGILKQANAATRQG